MKSNFENLDVWKKSCRLTVKLHELLKETNSFWIKDQILRSALSITKMLQALKNSLSDKPITHSTSSGQANN